MQHLSSPKDWIVWNKETRSIIDIGDQSTMEWAAEMMNRNMQTDAYKAYEFIPGDRNRRGE